MMYLVWGCIITAFLLAAIGALTKNQGVCVVAGGVALIGFVLSILHLTQILAS